MPDPPSLVSQLTLEEKVSLLAGKDFWQTHSVDRLNIPSMKTSDGPNGARGGLFKGGVSSACFPACVSLAATFDRSLARRIGKALAQETRTKGASVLLGPTVCPHRDPRGGRNFESFSEDPFLAGELASEYIWGLQQQGIGATIKHYAANESETKRFSIDARMTQRALREIYLKPFEIAVKKSDPWAVMTSYNLINGVHADMNNFLITKVLREEWKFSGLVMSDWGGTNSTAESLNAGHDLEMPGPAMRRTFEKVSAAIKNGELSEETLNKRVMKNLELLVRCDKFANPNIAPEQAIDLTEHRQLIRQAGAEGMVLLKNDNDTLPLKPQKLKSIAMLGLPKEFLGHGGGSAAVNAHHKITPYKAFEEALGDKVQLKYSEGAHILRNLRPLKEGVLDEEGNPGFTCRVYTTDTDTPSISNQCGANYMSLERPNLSAVTLTGTLKPITSGSHYLSFATVGNTKISINDEEIFRASGPSADIMAFLLGTASEERKQYAFTAGHLYNIKIEATVLKGMDSELSILANPLIGFNFGFALQKDFEADLYTPAVETVKDSDIAIVFVGNTPTWETEGCDRDSMDLPMDGSLDKLIAGCASVNKDTIVVNCSGSPITMPWINDVAAVVQAWFPGQEAGYAIADVLLGKVNPSGKLPVTFPTRVEDAPTYENFPGNVKELHVDYKEDIFMGYKHYDSHPEAVLFPFGYGLSYTTFQVSHVSVSNTTLRPTDSFNVSATITNTGSVAGRETMQIFVGPASDNECAVDRPTKVLSGWAKTKGLAAEQSESVSASISVKESMQYWDEERYKWIVPKGRYIVYVGTSSAEKDSVRNIEVEVSEQGDFDP